MTTKYSAGIQFACSPAIGWVVKLDRRGFCLTKVQTTFCFRKVAQFASGQTAGLCGLEVGLETV